MILHRCCFLVSVIILVSLLFEMPASFAQGPVFTEQQWVTPPDPAPSQSFGFQIALSAGWLAVSAQGDATFALGSGAVYTFVQGPLGWVFEQKLLPSGPVGFVQSFGGALALSGDRLIVTSKGFLGLGEVYVFDRIDSVWTQTALIGSPEPSGGFGTSLAILGERLVISATADSEVEPSAGAIYVYEQIAGQWQIQQKIIADDPIPNEGLGFSLAAGGNRIVARAGNVSAALNSLYIFVEDGGIWTQEQKLVAGNFTCFGGRVAFNGEHIALQARCLGMRFVQIFENTATGWEVMQAIEDSDGIPGIDFGDSIHLAENRIVVGAERAVFSSGGPEEGAAYVFDLSPDTDEWIEVARLRSGMQVENNAYGWRVFVEGDTVLVSAHISDFLPELNNAGAVYSYSLTKFIRGDANSSGEVELSDAIVMLSNLFGDAPWSLSCADAVDANDDGQFDLADAITLLSALFVSGAAPVADPQSCGHDLTADGLQCWDYSNCP